MHTSLGKIRSARFGMGGYDDAEVVFEFELGGEGWGTCYTFACGWGHVSESELASESAKEYKWTHQSRLNLIGLNGWKVFELIQQAKVKKLDELVGIPIRAHFESPFGKIQSFEILKEVL